MNQDMNRQIDERIKELSKLLRPRKRPDDDGTVGVGVRKKTPPKGPKPSKAAAEPDKPKGGTQ